MRSSKLLLLLIALIVGGAVYFAVSQGGAGDALEPDSAGVTAPEPSNLPDVDTGLRVDEPEGTRTTLTEEESGQAQGSPIATDFSSSDANRLKGQVVDDKGDPIPECTVIFLADGSGAFSWKPQVGLDLSREPRSLTDEEGVFEFEDLPPGDTHALVVHHPDVLMKLVEGVIIGDFGEFIEPPIVLRFGKRMRGVVKNELGFPIADARLHLDGRWIPTDPQESVDRLSTTTDHHGKYQILGIPDGTRCLTVEAEGYGSLTRIQSLVFSDKTGESHIVNFTLKSQAELSGRITDLEGSPVPGAEVVAVDRSAYRDVANARVLVDEEGYYSVRGLQAGKYAMRASAPGYMQAIMLDVETPQQGLDLILTPFPMVRGQIVDAESGDPITSFSLRYRQPGGFGGASIPTGEFRAFTSAVAGEFSIPVPVPPSKWILEARAPGYAPAESEAFTTSMDVDTVGIALAMTRGGGLKGRLVDGDGAPLFAGRLKSHDDAWIDDAFSEALGDQGEGDGTVREARSEKDGSFKLEHLNPGAYQLTARTANRHQVQVRGLNVVNGETLDVGDIVLELGASLRGTLYDSESSPIPGGLVFLRPKDSQVGAVVRRAKSGGTGEFRIHNIVPGSYLISATPPGTDRGSFTLWPSGTGDDVLLQGGIADSRDVHLDDWTLPKPPPPLPPSGYVTGSLLGTDGAGIVGASLELVPAKPGRLQPHMAKTEREGRFTFIRVLPGDYILFATGHDQPRIPVTVIADEWTNRDVELTE